MATTEEYVNLALYLNNIYDIIRNGANSLGELKKVCHTVEVSEKTGLNGLPDFIIETISQFLGESSDSYVKVNTLISEWNEHVAPIFGVRCNTFDEFAIQAATVSSQWAKYKSAEAMQQQPVQTQQNQMFVDVNTLINENNYLKSLNVSKDEEIKSLRERLVALGQPV